MHIWMSGLLEKSWWIALILLTSHPMFQMVDNERVIKKFKEDIMTIL